MYTHTRCLLWALDGLIKNLSPSTSNNREIKRNHVCTSLSFTNKDPPHTHFYYRILLTSSGPSILSFTTLF